MNQGERPRTHFIIQIKTTLNPQSKYPIHSGKEIIQQIISKPTFTIYINNNKSTDTSGENPREVIRNIFKLKP